ncbi:hypothetical protein [Haloferula sp.]|uniref:hypothetical protein n=1 Tax=Haloferula sp. TaxID=2497595 RepID=UPI00329B71D8
MIPCSSPSCRIIGVLILCGLTAFITWSLCRPDGDPVAGQELTQESRDTLLVQQLLGENLSTRRFAFPTIVQASAERQVIPLDKGTESHRRVIAAIRTALDESVEKLSRSDSPIRKLRRINEGSRFFEESLLEKINATEGLVCEIPTNREGEHQRSGYPDLKVVDETSGDIFYLDPKLVEQDSWRSSFRTFYFEPKTKTLKINDDAVHLLVGIGHDGKSGAWTFGEWKIVDLSTLTVRLKAEFQASNADLYKSGDKE